MRSVPLVPRTTNGFGDVLEPEERRRLDDALHLLRERLAHRRLWHVNSTATGGGVAEMLGSLLPYMAGAGIDVSWLVVEGDEPFFDLTKRLHNRLHGAPGDGGPLGPAERAAYDAALGAQRGDLLRAVCPGDVAVLHDPQTAGLIRPLRDHGAHVVWRCHIGIDQPDALVREGWAFLADDVAAASATVFTRPQYVWVGLPPDRVVTMAPCVDVLSPKNQPLGPNTTAAILDAAGIIRRPTRDSPAYTDADGARRLVRRRAELTEDAPAPANARLVAQVSRWDRLKDPVGVMRAFTEHGPQDPDTHLLLVGPMDGVADDPESTDVFEEVARHRQALSEPDRRRVHLARIPMDDPAENAAIVNAVQRRADVVVQKSLAEGFGLTVAEAMWKERPVVASRVGGIQDQIVHGESGLLVDDPTDLAACGRALRRVLGDQAAAHRLGAAARQRVCDLFLPVQHVEAEARLLGRILEAPASTADRLPDDHGRDASPSLAPPIHGRRS